VHTNHYYTQYEGVTNEQKPSDEKEGNQQVVLMRKGIPIQVAEAHQTEHHEWRKESLKWRDTWETKLWKETPIK
jgi:hypothetical protein